MWATLIAQVVTGLLPLFFKGINSWMSGKAQDSEMVKHWKNFVKSVADSGELNAASKLSQDYDSLDAQLDEMDKPKK